MPPPSDFLSDAASFTLPERDINFCLKVGDYARVLQRLIEETDPTDKREKLVRPRFAAAIMAGLFHAAKLSVPSIIAAIVDLPQTPKEYQQIPRRMAKMAENAMMGIQANANEAWLAEGVEIELKGLPDEIREQYSEAEMGFMDALHLKTLDLSHNRLPELPDNLHALSHLELLNLSQNPMEKIPAGILYMNELHYLKIDGKTINALDHYASFKSDLRKKIKQGEARFAGAQGHWPGWIHILDKEAGYFDL